MGILDRIKDLVSPFKARPSVEEQSQPASNISPFMPDISTQTPKSWGSFSIDSPGPGPTTTSPSRPITGRGNMSSQMDQKSWNDCLEVIERYSKWDGSPKHENEGASAGVIQGKETASTTAEKKMEEVEPSTPGDHRYSSAEESPSDSAKQAKPGPVFLDMFHGGGRDHAVDIPTQQEKDFKERGLAVGHQVDVVPVSTEVPIAIGDVRSLRIAEVKEQIAAPNQCIHAVPNIESDNTATSDNQQALSFVRVENHDTERAEGQLQSEVAGYIGRSSEIESATHQLSRTNELSKAAEDDFPVEALLPGITSEARPRRSISTQPVTCLRSASPDIPFDITPVGYPAEAIAPSSVDQPVAVSVQPIDPALHSFRAPLTLQTDGYLGYSSSAGGVIQTTPAVIDSASEVQGGVTQYFDSVVPIAGPQIQSQGDVPLTLPATNAAQHVGGTSQAERFDIIKADATFPLANMPVLLPDAFHQSVLDEVIANGATEDEQYFVMEGLRGVERKATIKDIAHIEGAMEVDSDALALRAVIGPAALSSTTTPIPGNNGRKRKSEGLTVSDGNITGKGKRSKSSVVALTNQEHLANGWTYLPREHFQAKKAPEIKNYLRTIESQRRWWNGLTKGQMINKIVEWQNEMKELQEQMIQEQEADDSQATIPLQMDGIEFGSLAEPEPFSRTVEASTTRPASRATSVATRKSKSMTPVPPRTPVDQIVGAPNDSSSTKSVFYDPDAERRSTPLTAKFAAVKAEANKQDVAIANEESEAAAASVKAKAKGSGFSSAFQAALDSDEISHRTKSETVEPHSRRSRSKTVDSANHTGSQPGKTDAELSVSKGNTKAAKHNRKSRECSGGPNARTRSLRSRTGSIAPEGYGP